MDAQSLTYFFVALSFGLYIGIAIWSRAGSTNEFYVAGGGVHPIANGMATAADWMSAASFISMAGIIAFMGYDGAVYLMGWTGGYVILALLLAPYLRKFGQFTVPDFIGTRYYSTTARVVAVICLILISFTYVAGTNARRRYRVLPVSQYPDFLGRDRWHGHRLYVRRARWHEGHYLHSGCPVLCADLCLSGAGHFHFHADHWHPDSANWTGRRSGGRFRLIRTRQARPNPDGIRVCRIHPGGKSTIDVFAITMALMIGTAGLPHVIVRFFTVPKVSDARKVRRLCTDFYRPAVHHRARSGCLCATQLCRNHPQHPVQRCGGMVQKLENIGLIGWEDKNQDGRIQYHPGAPFDGKPNFGPERRADGSRDVLNTPTTGDNEVYVDRDIMVLANPEIAALPDWVIALVAAGSLAAALSTAAGLLLVISTSVSHDLMKKTFAKGLTDRQELFYARLAAVTAIGIAGYLGIDPPGFVAQVVAFAFGLAAASLFPAILLGIFDKRMNREGAIVGMLAGLLFSLAYIAYFKFVSPESNNAEYWLFGISPEESALLAQSLTWA